MPLSEFKIAAKYWFGIYDSNPKDEELNLREFRNVYLKVLPESPMRKATKWSQIQSIYDAYDADQNDAINFDEFWAITRFREDFESEDFKEFSQKSTTKKEDTLPEITLEMSDEDYKAACTQIFNAFAVKIGDT